MAGSLQDMHALHRRRENSGALLSLHSLRRALPAQELRRPPHTSSHTSKEILYYNLCF